MHTYIHPYNKIGIYIRSCILISALKSEGRHVIAPTLFKSRAACSYTAVDVLFGSLVCCQICSFFITKKNKNVCYLIIYRMQNTADDTFLISNIFLTKKMFLTVLRNLIWQFKMRWRYCCGIYTCADVYDTYTRREIVGRLKWLEKKCAALFIIQLQVAFFYVLPLKRN